MFLPKKKIQGSKSVFFYKEKTDLWEKKKLSVFGCLILEEQAVETTLTATPGSKRRGWSDRHQLRER